MLIESLDMNTPLRIDDARAVDIQAIRDLWQSIGDDNTSAIRSDAELLRTLMSGLDYFVLRRNVGLRVIGAVSVMDCTRNLAKIDSLAVHYEHQGNGYGRELAKRAVDHCVDNGYHGIITTALPSSQRIFTGLGFETCDVHRSGNATMFLDIA